VKPLEIHESGDWLLSAAGIEAVSDQDCVSSRLWDSADSGRRFRREV
jgi:hypothetical protein